MTICKPPQFRPVSMTFEQKKDLLFQLGYFISEKYPNFSKVAKSKLKRVTENSAAYEEAVAKYQEFYRDDYAEQYEDYRPKIDGEFGLKTMQATENMLSRRYCAHPDISELGEGHRRWNFMEITYSHQLQKLSGVSATVVHRNYVESWNRWNTICGLKANFTSNTSRANVQAYAGRIDGRGGTLAWSYLPSSSGSGKGTELEQKYDTGDRWAGNSAFQLEVMTHENGHAAGLDHDNGKDSSGRRSIMSSSAIGIRELNSNDIKQMVKRYGEPLPVDPTDPTIPPVFPPQNSGSIVLTETDGRIRKFTENTSGTGGWF